MAEGKYPKSIFLSAGELFRIARSAYERTKSTPARDVYPQDPLVAIVFAAASLEAFINEAGELANSHAKTTPDSVTTFANLTKKVEDLRGPTSLKFSLLYVAFTGISYNSGQHPFQDFELLVSLRNSLIHLKPYVSEIKFSPEGERMIEFPKLIEKLRSENILFQGDVGTSPNWIKLISTPAMARWACNTAASMVQAALRVVPQSGTFKFNLDKNYGQTFLPIT